MQFSAILPMGESVIASSSHPVPCRDSNSNDITNITNITSVENKGVVNGTSFQEGAISLGN